VVIAALHLPDVPPDLLGGREVQRRSPDDVDLAGGNETCLVIGNKGGFNADRLAEQLPFVIFGREALPFDRLDELIMIYSDFRHMLIEVPEELSK
jgi:hypothetical protein